MLIAHIESGFAIDVWENDGIDAYKRRFAEDMITNWNIVEVPASTQPGAKDNGDGTFTNPIPPAPAPSQPKPIAINKQQFIDLYAANNADLTQTLAAWPEA